MCMRRSTEHGQHQARIEFPRMSVNVSPRLETTIVDRQLMVLSLRFGVAVTFWGLQLVTWYNASRLDDITTSYQLEFCLHAALCAYLPIKLVRLKFTLSAGNFR